MGEEEKEKKRENEGRVEKKIQIDILKFGDKKKLRKKHCRQVIFSWFVKNEPKKEERESKLSVEREACEEAELQSEMNEAFGLSSPKRTPLTGLCEQTEIQCCAE